MRALHLFFVALVLSCGIAAGAADASDEGSLFVNMTTDDLHRADMAFTFAQAQMKLGHPVTIWLNDKGVFLADKDNAERAAKPQEKLKALMADGAAVISCPMCMKHYGVKDSNLIDGVKIGKPELTEAALFKNGAQTLTW